MSPWFGPSTAASSGDKSQSIIWAGPRTAPLWMKLSCASSIAGTEQASDEPVECCRGRMLPISQKSRSRDITISPSLATFIF